MTQDLIHAEAEQAVLGTILIARDEASFIAGLAKMDDFCLPTHRLIFEAMQAELAKGCAPNPVVLHQHFRNDKIGDRPVNQYLIDLMQHSVDPRQAVDCVKTLKEYTGRRVLAGISAEMAEAAKTKTTSIRDYSLSIIDQLDDVCASIRHQKKTSAGIGKAARDLIETLRSGRQQDLITTGLIGVDSMLGGWHRGELAIVAARPSMGKTTFMVSSLRQAAARGVNSLFFSMEMRTEAVMQRMFSDVLWNAETPIPYVRIANYNLKEHEIDRLEEYCEWFDSVELTIDDNPQMTVAEIGVRARRVKDELERRGKTLDVVCIDHLGKIKSTGRYEGNLVNETGEKSADLAALCRELNVALIVVHQLNRESEHRGDSHPVLSDLRDSGNVEQDADTVCFVYREAYSSERTKFSDNESEIKRLEIIEATKNDMDIIIAKNRNGPCGTVELHVDMSSNAVRDRADMAYYNSQNLRNAS